MDPDIATPAGITSLPTAYRFVDPFVIVASSASAVSARLFTHPLDTMRIRVQTYPGAVVPPLRELIPKTNTIRALYAGLPVAIAFSMPALSVYLTSYEASKRYLAHHFLPVDQKPSILQQMPIFLIAGGVAEVASGAFWTPLEVLKCRLQKGGEGTTSGLNPSLPTETIRQILEHALESSWYDDRQLFLLQTSLVSRAWLEPSQSLLWHGLQLDLSAMPAIVPRLLSSDACGRHPTTTVHLTQFYGDQASPKENKDLLEELLDKITGVKELYVNSFKGFPAHLLAAKGLPGVKTLALHGTNISDFDSPTTLPLPNLSHLTLQVNPAPLLFSSLLSSPNSPKYLRIEGSSDFLSEVALHLSSCAALVTLDLPDVNIKPEIFKKLLESSPESLKNLIMSRDLDVGTLEVVLEERENGGRDEEFEELVEPTERILETLESALRAGVMIGLETLNITGVGNGVDDIVKLNGGLVRCCEVRRVKLSADYD
ncbi:hypothetical protein P7C70_g5202, partial [Phenoliferia sp. Uapishka_3]